MFIMQALYKENKFERRRNEYLCKEIIAICDESIFEYRVSETLFHELFKRR